MPVLTRKSLSNDVTVTRYFYKVTNHILLVAIITFFHFEAPFSLNVRPVAYNLVIFSSILVLITLRLDFVFRWKIRCTLSLISGVFWVLIIFLAIRLHWNIKSNEDRVILPVKCNWDCKATVSYFTNVQFPNTVSHWCKYLSADPTIRVVGHGVLLPPYCHLGYRNDTESM